MEINKVLEALTPEIVEKFKLAIELGKWPDGRRLTPEQLETCMQAVIAFEHKYVDEKERTGYVPPKTACGPDEHEEDSPLKWQE